VKNVLKLTALLAIFACANAHESVDLSEETVQVTFPEFIHKNAYDKYPCQLYVQEEDGTIFIWVKLNPKYPYAILPNNMLGFRGKNYVVVDVQEFGQEDFAVIECPVGCISIKMEPYE
jgi:hypothetical protein